MGKTHYIIEKINKNSEQPYLYISPLRKMFERIEGAGEYTGKGANRKFYTPNTQNVEHRKLRGLKDLIEVGCNIMSTHALFLTLDEDAISMLKARNYTLVIDEALDAVTVLSKPSKDEEYAVEDEEYAFQNLNQRVTNDDIEWLLQNNHVRIDEKNYNQVVWIGNSEDLNHRYKDVERIVKTGAVSYANGVFLIWSFPISALDAFAEIFVLTYRFDSSIMQGYLNFYGKSYDHKTIIRKGGKCSLTDYRPEIGSGSRYFELINICKADSLNAIGVRSPRGKWPLSVSWYRTDKRSGGERRKTLKNNITNYFRHYCKADKDSVMWTTFKEHKGIVQPQGFTKRSDGVDTFVACTCRATEEYKGKNNLAYLVDRHLHPGVVAFLAQRDVVIDNDQYALSELIQWIFRSRVRDGEKINLYIPSQRMRNLLQNWLFCER